MNNMRPTEYNGDFCIRAQEYLESCVDEEYERIRSQGEESTSYDNLIRVNLPSIEGLALHLDINRDTVYDWRGKYPQFSDIVEKILISQAQRLMNNGLAGTYNASISKLMLSKHGYVDRSDVTTNGKDLPAPIISVDRDVPKNDSIQQVKRPDETN